MQNASFLRKNAHGWNEFVSSKSKQENIHTNKSYVETSERLNYAAVVQHIVKVEDSRMWNAISSRFRNATT